MKNKITDNKEYAQRKTLLKMMAAYASIMLLILITAVTTAKSNNGNSVETVINEKISTEYIYINKNEPVSTLPIEDTKTQEIYLIKEYMGRIGIFDTTGALVDVIEVYTKTLPEADRRLLGEGFEVIGKTQLNAIIEDYS